MVFLNFPRHFLLRSVTVLLAAASASAALSGCGIQPRSSLQTQTTSPDLIRAEDWDSISFTVAGARTDLSRTGHFSTTPNACYRRETGALELSLWNRLSFSVNRMLAQSWMTEAQCSARPAGAADLYQPVKVKRSNGTEVELLSTRGSQLCTRSVDVASANQLVVALAEAAQAARLEGCPRSLLWLAPGLDSPEPELNEGPRAPNSPADSNEDSHHQDPDHHSDPGPAPHPHPQPDRPEQKGKQDGDDYPYPHYRD